MTILVDSHCHLDLIPQATPEQLITAARQYQVNYLLCVSIDLAQFVTMMEMIAPFDTVFASVGVHPNTEPTHFTEIDTLVKLADPAKVIAIGETGLDYYRSHGELAWQQERFRTHIRAAREIGKPLIVHSREARDDTIRILREERATEVGGIMHCFVDDWDMAQQAMDMGFYISFSGIVTFNKATALQAVAKQIPLERLLVETDSPYLSPVPHRGKTNQPAHVYHVASYIAKLRNIAFETLAQATTDNFFRLFNRACHHLN